MLRLDQSFPLLRRLEAFNHSPIATSHIVSKEKGYETHLGETHQNIDKQVNEATNKIEHYLTKTICKEK